MSLFTKQASPQADDSGDQESKCHVNGNAIKDDVGQFRQRKLKLKCYAEARSVRKRASNNAHKNRGSDAVAKRWNRKKHTSRNKPCWGYDCSQKNREHDGGVHWSRAPVFKSTQPFRDSACLTTPNLFVTLKRHPTKTGAGSGSPTIRRRIEGRAIRAAFPMVRHSGNPQGLPLPTGGLPTRCCLTTRLEAVGQVHSERRRAAV